MPWENQNGGVRFSGRLADLMAIIMTAYDQDTPSGACAGRAGDLRHRGRHGPSRGRHRVARGRAWPAGA